LQRENTVMGLLRSFGLLTLAKADTRTAAVLVNEFDAAKS
jgi:hypothetical protein